MPEREKAKESKTPESGKLHMAHVCESSYMFLPVSVCVSL